MIVVTLAMSFLPASESEALPNTGCYKTTEEAPCYYACSFGGSKKVTRINCYVWTESSIRHCSPCPQNGVYDCAICSEPND